MEIKNTIKISAPVSPYDSDDSYPTHLAEFGKGGHRSVPTLEERNLIPEERREVGMTVYVEEDDSIYILRSGITNEDWVYFGSLLSGGSIGNLTVSVDPPKDPTNKTAWLNLNDLGLYVRDPDNITWISAISYAVDGGDF